MLALVVNVITSSGVQEIKFNVNTVAWHSGETVFFVSRFS